MTSGGARNRSGPSFDPRSATSEALGRTLLSLPRSGYRGKAPEWPKPALEGDSNGVDRRAREIWLTVWKYPQAAEWKKTPYRWEIIAEMCLLMAQIEVEPGKAAIVAQVHRYRDQLGLTPAGMKENGWQIEPAGVKKPRGKTSGGSRSRLQAV